MKWMILLAVSLSQFAAAVTPPPKVGIDQNIGGQLPMSVPFRSDVDGRERPLGSYFTTGRPAIFVMGYFSCPQLCSVVMNGLVQSMSEIQPRVGRDFDVFFVSIDPNESWDLGAQKKRSYVRSYGKLDSTNGWHFLTGSKESINRTAKAMGFRYWYDPELKQYAHGSGFAVVTPSGKLSKYFYGIDYPAKNVAAAIRDARKGQDGSPVQELLLMCYHYNPITGPYGMAIWRSLQGAALLTLGALGFFIVQSLRRERKVTI